MTSLYIDSVQRIKCIELTNFSLHFKKNNLIHTHHIACHFYQILKPRGKSILEFSSRLTATLNLCLIYFEITWALAILYEHMHKKFEINRTKIKGGSQLGRKVVTNNSKSDLPLVLFINFPIYTFVLFHFVPFLYVYLIFFIIAYLTNKP